MEIIVHDDVVCIYEKEGKSVLCSIMRNGKGIDIKCDSLDSLVGYIEKEFPLAPSGNLSAPAREDEYYALHEDDHTLKRFSKNVLPFKIQ